MGQSYKAPFPTEWTTDYPLPIEDLCMQDWDRYIEAQCDGENAIAAMMEHSAFDHHAHVRLAEQHYWSVDHSAHLESYYESSIPF